MKIRIRKQRGEYSWFHQRVWRVEVPDYGFGERYRVFLYAKTWPRAMQYADTYIRIQGCLEER